LVEPFVVLSRHLHFRSASTTLGVSQQTLSDQIRRLEQQLDLTLFTRDSRHVALTEAGHSVLADAQRVLTALGRLADGRRDRGLRLGAVKDYGPAVVLIDRFRRARPTVPLDIVDASSVEQLDALEAGAIDVGILRLADAAPTGVVTTPLQLEPVLVAVGPHHPMAHAETIPLAGLTRILCGAGPEWTSRRAWLDALAAHVGARWTYTAGCGPTTVNAVTVASDPTLAALVPATSTSAFVAVGCPVRPPRELQPCYPWSLAWRDPPDDHSEQFVRHAVSMRSTDHWLDPPDPSDDHRPWLPDTDPVLDILTTRSNSTRA
jgi:DNA-binding transcriptional LysR family regulator